MLLRFEDGRCLRDAERSDLPAIVEIYNSTIPGRAATADTEPVSVESRESWLAAHVPERRPLWVLADTENKVDGRLSFQDFYGRPAYSRTAEVSVYVREACRGSGIGSRLLDQAIMEGPTLGLATLLAFVLGHNVASLRLFESRGFARWAHLPRVAELDAVERDLVILGRRIDSVLR